MDTLILDLDPAKYKTGKDGRVKVFWTNSIVTLETDKDEYNFEDKVRLVGQKVVGLRAEEPADPQQYVVKNKVVAAAEVFNSAKISLRNGTDVIMEKYPLRQIAKDNERGITTTVHASSVNWKESTLYVPNASAISDNEVIVIQIAYVKEK